MMSLVTLSGQTLEGTWREDPTLCPHCGRVSWPVPQNITLVAHVREAEWPRVKVLTDRFKGFRFCPHLGCPVVYFHRDAGLVVVEAEVRTRVGYKVDTPPIPVCYCIGVLAETIRAEVVVKGCCDSLEDIQRYTGARTGKWCHITNPSGRCCGPMVQRVIEAALRERVEAGVAEQARRLAEQIPSDGVGEAPDIVPDTCCRLGER